MASAANRLKLLRGGGSIRKLQQEPSKDIIADATVVEELKASFVKEDEIDEALAVEQAIEAFQEATVLVNKATKSARAAWYSIRHDSQTWDRDFYSASWERIDLVRQQSSTVLRLAAIIADEPTKQAKPRRPLLPRFFTFVGWFLLMTAMVGSLYYIIFWIRSRRNVVEDEVAAGAMLDVDKEEKDIIVQWATASAIGVAISYLVAEPMIALFRYVLIPQILQRFGSAKKPETVEFDEDKHTMEMLENAGKKGGIREGHGHIAADVIADLVEAMF